MKTEKGADYTKLRDLLQAQKWKEADCETYRLMITIVGRKERDYFSTEDLLNFPCKDLKTIGCGSMPAKDAMGSASRKKFMCAAVLN